MYKQLLEKIAKTELLAKGLFNPKEYSSFDYEHGDEHPKNSTNPNTDDHRVAHTAINGKTYWNQKFFRHKGTVGDQGVMDKLHNTKTQEFLKNNPELSNNKDFVNSLTLLNSSVINDPDRGLRISGTSNHIDKDHTEIRQRHLLHALGGTEGYSIENVLHPENGSHIGVRVKARRHPPGGEHSETSWFYGKNGLSTEYNKPLNELKTTGLQNKGPAKKRKITNINDLLRMAASEKTINSEGTFSEQEAIDMIKYLLMQKFEENKEFTLEELEKNWKTAFRTGLTVLGLIHGAHYIGQDRPIEKQSSIKEQSPKESVQKIKQKKEEASEKIDRSPSSQQEDHENKINSFLSTISMNESSGGKNTDHVQMKHGIHAGDSAIGQYGLMPNTIQEMARRSGDKSLRSYGKMNSREIADSIRKNPEHEHQIANFMANHLHNKHGGDESKMAYSWNQGHNLTQDHFDTNHKNYKNHDYVKKYHKNKGMTEKTLPKEIKTNKLVSN